MDEQLHGPASPNNGVESSGYETPNERWAVRLLVLPVRTVGWRLGKGRVGQEMVIGRGEWKGVRKVVKAGR